MPSGDQVKQQRAQIRKTAVTAEVDKVFKVQAAGPQLAPVQDTEEQKTLKKMRLEAIRESSHFEVPQYAAKEQLYAEKPKSEFASAKKRQKEIDKQGSVLQRKVQNRAEILLVEDSLKTKMTDTDAFFEEAIASGKEVHDIDREALFGFLSDTNKAADMAKINNYAFGGDARMDVINDCMKEFMKVDFASLEIETDEQLTRSARDLVKIREMMHSLDLMIQLNPEYMYRISDEAKELFRVHHEEAQKLVGYYDFKMQVITDKYYSEHLNSEIGHRYDPAASPEMRALSMKISMADAAHKKYSPAAAQIVAPKMKDVSPRMTEKYCTTTPMLVGEFGKNSEAPHAYRHRDFIGFKEGREKALVTKLCDKPYQVAGGTITSAESFTRHLFCLTSLKACQAISEGDFMHLLDKMNASPADPADPAEVEKARKANLEGMRTFMDMMATQIHYLDRKYGQGFGIMTPEEMRDHYKDFDMDFANFAGFVSFLDYCSNFPELVTKDDREVLKKAKYFDLNVLSHCASGLYLRDYHVDDESKKHIDPKTRISYTDYKRAAGANFANMPGTGETSHAMKDAHADVRWLTTLVEGEVKPFELAKFFNDDADFAILLARYKETHPNQDIEWQKMMPETERLGLDGDATAEEMIRIEFEAQKAAMFEDWKLGGVQSGASNLPGIGSDDQDVVCSLYSEMAANPALMAQRGIVDPAQQEEFKRLILEWQDVGERMREAEYRSNAALAVTTNYMRGGTKDPLAKAVFKQMRTSFQKVGDRYAAEYTRVKNEEGVAINDKLHAFLSSHDVFTFPEHAEKYDEIAREKMGNMVFDRQVVVSGITYTTTKAEGDYAEHDLVAFLTGKQLNDGVNPAAFGALVQEYNDFLGKILIDGPLRWSVKTEDDMSKLPDWKKIEHKKGFFMFDLDTRFWWEQESLQALRKKMGGMIH